MNGRLLGRWLLRPLALMALVLCAALPGHADDVDIYTNPSSSTLSPPNTILVIDLNLLGICNNVLLNPSASSDGNNPLGQTACINLRASTSLLSFLTPITSNPATFLTNLLTGSGLGAAGLCNLYGLLGLNSPVVAIPALGPLLAPLLGGVTTLSCSTLAFLTGIPLLSSIINGLIPGFVTQLIAGLVNPLLSSLIGALPSAIIGLVDAALAAPQKILADPLSVNNLISTISGLLTPLINSKVAIVVAHGNRSNAAGTPVTLNGKSYACSFADLAAIPGQRRDTTNCSNGAYVLLGFTQLGGPTTVASVLTLVSNQLLGLLNPTNLINVLGSTLGSLTTANLSSLTPPYQGKEIYTEIAHYLGGDTVYNAPLKTWDSVLGLLSRDTSIEAAGRYVQPPLACTTVNVVNIQLTNSTGDDDSDTEVARYWPGAVKNGAISFADVVAEAKNTGFTDTSGRKIALNSYFVIQENLSSISALTNIGANLLSYTSSLGLLNLGQTVADFIQPVLVTDASLQTTGVATSRTTSTGLLDYAFVPEFRPKAGRKPSWDGNLKRLKLLRAANGSYSFVDANGTAAIASDGRISASALTFWTRTAQLGGASADGRTATLGGAGQNIPGYAFGGGGNPGRVNADGKRKLFYDELSASKVPSLAALDADSQTVRDSLKTDLGVTGTASSDDTTRRALLLQARGFDVGTTTSPKGTGSSLTGVTGRPWLMGALLHSRPVAVNYGARSGYTSTDPDVRLLFGTTDGFMHSVVNGPAATPSGVESWAFMPRATMKYLSTLRNDNYQPDFPYGVDGSPSVLVIDRSPSGGAADGVIDSGNANDHAYAFFGLRRGGSNYYGLDITNPDSPSLIWRIGTDGLYSTQTSTPGFASGSAAWFSELGLTFSSPIVGRIRYLNASNVEVERSILVFGGGYNGGVSSGARVGKDLNNSRNSTTTAQVGTDDTKGNAIYMVDAVTGELIWKAVRGNAATPAWDSTTLSFRHPMFQDSIPSDVALIDSDGDGLSDRLYVGDTGGRVWRADFSGSDRSKWTAGPIASLGRSHPVAPAVADSTNANDRRFFHAPDFIPARGPITTTVNGVTTTTAQNYDVVVIGSGDREDPFNTGTTNWLYAIRDRDTTSGKVVGDTTVNGVIATESDSRLFKQTDLTDLTTACASSSTSTCAAAVGLPNGWRLQLTGSGEKAFSAPVTVNNTVTLSTYVPPSASTTRCVPDEGTGKVYGVNLLDSRPYVQQFISDGDGAPRSTAAKSAGLPGEATALTPQLIGVNNDTVGTNPPLVYRTYWRERRGDEPERVKQ